MRAVITRVDALLVEEAERTSFRFLCRDCAHRDDSSGRCSFGWPTAPLEREALVPGDAVEFCKDFELR